MLNHRMLTVVLCALLLAPPALAADWPQFRGPSGNAVADGHGFPAQWSADQNIAWTFEVPGRGWAAPVIVDGRVIVVTAAPEGNNGELKDRVHRWQVYCLSLENGDVLWHQVAKRAKPTLSTHRDNTYASETPVTDGERVYAYFGMTGLYCYDLDGERVWQKGLEAYPMAGDWGTSSSPALHDGRLYLQVDNEDASFLVALDASTGDELWRVPREGETSSWSTPVIWRNRARTELVALGGHARSYNPETGKELWRLDMAGRSSASAAATEDLLIVGAEDRSSRGGGPGGIFAVTPDAAGDITPPAGASSGPGVLWSTRSDALGMASPLIYRGHVYVLTRRGGMVNCYDADTGERAYRQRLPGARAFWASPWAYDGKVFCPADNGVTLVLAAGGEYDLLGVNEIPGRFWATAALGDGALVLRGAERLYCIRAE